MEKTRVTPINQKEEIRAVAAKFRLNSSDIESKLSDICDRISNQPSSVSKLLLLMENSCDATNPHNGKLSNDMLNGLYTIAKIVVKDGNVPEIKTFESFLSSLNIAKAEKLINIEEQKKTIEGVAKTLEIFEERGFVRISIKTIFEFSTSTFNACIIAGSADEAVKTLSEAVPVIAFAIKENSLCYRVVNNVLSSLQDENILKQKLKLRDAELMGINQTDSFKLKRL